MSEEKVSIKALYDNAQELIAIVNEEIKKEKEPKKDMLDSIKEIFTQFINFEKMYLINAKDAFYGLILSEIDIEINFKSRGAIDTIIDKGRAGETRLLIFINPLFCQGYKIREFTGVLVSEVLKLLYEHPAAFATLNHEKDLEKHKNLERGSEGAVSSMILNEIRGIGDSFLGLPKDVYTPNKISNESTKMAKDKGSLEYYYYFLEEFSKKDNNENSSNESGNEFSSNKNENENSNSPASPSNNNGNDIHQWEGIDEEDTATAIKGMVQRVFDSMDSNSRGFIPGSILEQIKVLLAPPEINWKQILRKMVGAVSVPNRKTPLRLNRRQPERIDIRGHLPKRIVRVVVAIDTSGSMSDEVISYVINEVFNIVKGYEAKVTIIECDAEINKIYSAKKVKDVQTKVAGRGGTSFIPVIEFLNGTTKEKKWKEHPSCGKFKDSLLVYFTDGYGDYEIPKPRTFRNLWVVMENEKNLSLKNPYGEVKSLSTDKDWKKKRGF